MVWANPRSLAATRRITFVFSSSGYLDVSVLRVRLPYGILYLQYCGLPHSDIHGSMVICTSPWLFAAYHVLLRLWEPRHPPCALLYFLSWCLSISEKTYTKALLLFCSVLVLLFESYVFQYVNERFDLFWSLWYICCFQQHNLFPMWCLILMSRSVV